MIKFELKKIFSKPINRAALVLLIVLLAVVSMLTINRVIYVDENGNSLSGIHAAEELREEKNLWAGSLTEDRLAEVLKANTAALASPEASSQDIQEQNKAFSKQQGYEDIREIINNAFCDYREYDYYKIDHIAPKDLKGFYEKRVSCLKAWLKTGQEQFSDAEKQFLIEQYENLNTPFFYEYQDGWKSLLQNTPTFILILALIIGFFTAGIFSDEFQLKADSIFFSSRLGRGKAIRAKMAAGFLVVTVLYIVFTALYSIIVLSALGFDGAGCPLQFDMWRSIHNITFFQAFLLIVLGGYIGTLFASTLAMLVSAKIHITAIAVVLPFIVLCFFPFLSRIITLHHICALFPDRLLEIYITLKDFILFEIGAKAVNVESIIIPLYSLACLTLQPLLYIIYKRT